MNRQRRSFGTYRAKSYRAVRRRRFLDRWRPVILAVEVIALTAILWHAARLLGLI